MRNILLIFGAIVLLAGCTSKEEKAFMQAYEKNKSYHRQLQKTEKTQLYDGSTTKALLTATYLYSPGFQKEDKRDEVFIVGVYLEDNTVQNFNQNGFSLTLNGNIPKNIQKLPKGHPDLKDISFVSEWNQFYLVTFPHESSKSFRLIFKSDSYGKGELYFAKVAKYMLSREVL